MWHRTCIFWAAVCAVLPAIATATWGNGNHIAQKEEWNAKETPSCQVVPGDKSGQLEAVCEGINTLSEVGKLVHVKKQPRITKLAVTTSNMTLITLDHLHSFPALTTLSFNNSVLLEWSGPSVAGGPRVTRLVLDRCWNIDSLDINNMESSGYAFNFTVELLNALPDLREMHIEEIYLYHVGSVQLPPQVFLTIEGGGIECNDESLRVLDWVASGKAYVTNFTRCFVHSVSYYDIGHSFIHFYFLSIMAIWKDMYQDCPRPCKCIINGMNGPVPIIAVNCSRLGLSQIPLSIPAFTTTIDLENNTITNFSHIFTHPRYQTLDKIILAHNKITSLDGRLFYKFTHNRSLDLSIDLSYNQLSKFPVKEVHRIYEEGVKRGTTHLPVLKLGFNPWDCDDCSFLPAFQDIVYHIKYAEDTLKPYLDIRCREGASGDLAMQQVVKLDVNSLCKPDPPLLTPMDILVICLAVLLILFLLNFLHNFIQYRRHGKLPWIITKLPSC